MTKAFIIKVVIGVIALTAIVLLATWVLGGFGGLSANGVGALIIGTFASLLLGTGLMALVFMSDRSGYDQASYDASQDTQGQHLSPPKADF